MVLNWNPLPCQSPGQGNNTRDTASGSRFRSLRMDSALRNVGCPVLRSCWEIPMHFLTSPPRVDAILSVSICELHQAGGSERTFDTLRGNDSGARPAVRKKGKRMRLRRSPAADPSLAGGHPWPGNPLIPVSRDQKNPSLPALVHIRSDYFSAPTASSVALARPVSAGCVRSFFRSIPPCSSLA